MLRPLAMLPPADALIAWAVLLVTLLALQLWVLLDWAGLSWREPRGMLLISGSLAAAPLQFGLLCGQPSTAVVSLSILGMWCASHAARPWLGGVLLGLACALKPHIAAPFILYYLCLRRWRVVQASLAIVAVIVIVSIAMMQRSQPTWMSDWRASMSSTTTTGGVNDRAPSGPFRDQIIDMQMLLIAVARDPSALRVLVACVTAALIAWYVTARPLARSIPRASARRDPGGAQSAPHLPSRL
jgi:hypothetical protein